MDTSIFAYLSRHYRSLVADIYNKPTSIMLEKLVDQLALSIFKFDIESQKRLLFSHHKGFIDFFFFKLNITHEKML